MKKQERDDDLSMCLSFNIYSSSSRKITRTAIEVSNEFINEFESRIDEEELLFNERLNYGDDDDEIEGNDDEFEFAFVNSTDLDFSLEHNDKQFRPVFPVFPVFTRDLLLSEDEHREIRESDESRDASVLIIPLKIDELGVKPEESNSVLLPQSSPERCKKSNSTGSSSKSVKRWSFRNLLRRIKSDGDLLLSKDERREIRESDSKSRDASIFIIPLEINELEGVKPEKSFSDWLQQSSPERCKKSNSTGSPSKLMKRWTFCDLLRRSNSDDKTNSSFDDDDKIKMNEIAAGKKMSPVHKLFYVKKRTIRDEKRRSYLPYRQDIVGLFANNINGFTLTKTFPPF